jgi:peptide/nickel transport system permease protein
MRQYAARRILFFFPVLLITSAVTFFAVNLIPGDPSLTFLGLEAERQQIEAFREANNLNTPVTERYVDWLWGMLRGDPGRSLLGGANIKSEIQARFPVTFMIMVFSFTFSMIFGLTFGIIAALYQDRGPDYFVRTFSVFGQSVPDFFTLTLLLLVPALLFRYSPPFGYVPFWEDPLRAARQIIPPTLILSIGNAALLMRLMRSALLEVLRQDYVRTARAKGLEERVVMIRHALKNATIPALTVAGALIANLLGGTIILENITSLPGLGQYTFRAVQQSDYNVVMAMTMYAAFLVITANLVVDLLYAFVDPRIRYR